MDTTFAFTVIAALVAGYTVGLWSSTKQIETAICSAEVTTQTFRWCALNGTQYALNKEAFK